MPGSGAVHRSAAATIAAVMLTLVAATAASAQAYPTGAGESCRAVRRGRRDRHSRSGVRRPAAAASRPAVHAREPRRRGRPDRRDGRGPFARRWLDLDVHHRRADHHRAADERQGAVRSAQGLRADRRGRGDAGLAGGQRELAAQVGRPTSSRTPRTIPASSTTAPPALAPSCILRPRRCPARPAIQMAHVPFRGGGEVIAALLGNQLDFAALSTASIAGRAEAGQPAGARGLVAAAHGRLSRCADLRRDRPSRRHHDAVVGLDGAGRHAAARRRAADAGAGDDRPRTRPCASG